MRMNLVFRLVVVAVTCVGVAAPRMAFAAAPVIRTAEGIPVILDVEDVAIPSGQLLGAIVDVNGRPVSNAPVAVGQAGKVLAELKTDQEGRFMISGLNNGTYQVATFAGVQSYRLWSTGAPQSAKQGIIHVLPEGVARGNSCDSAGGCSGGGAGGGALMGALTSPLVLAAAVAGAIAIAVVASNDDDGS